MRHWKRNLIGVGISQLLTLMSFNSYFPLIPYRMQELGATSYAEATSWMAIFSAGSAIAMMVSSPIWGSLGDRYGRKRLLQIGLVMFGALCGGAFALPSKYVGKTPWENLWGLFFLFATLLLPGFGLLAVKGAWDTWAAAGGIVESPDESVEVRIGTEVGGHGNRSSIAACPGG